MIDDDLDRPRRGSGAHRALHGRTRRARHQPPRPGASAPKPRVHRRATPLAAVAAAAAVAAGGAGCATTLGAAHRHPAAPAASTNPPASAAPTHHPSPQGPRRIIAEPLQASPGGELAVGSPIGNGTVAHRARVHGDVLVGLGLKGKLFGSVYPVRSTDGGGHWKTSGHVFYYPAAHGSAHFREVGVTPGGTVYVWGREGSLVEVSRGGMSPWSAATFPDGTKRAWNNGNTLWVRLESGALYDSTNGGRTWTSRH